MNVTQAAESRKGVSPVLATARACLVAGISSLPATEDGEKHPFAPWKQYQKRLPTVDEISTWFSPQRKGIGIIAGKVSGNLEALDFETWEIFLTYEELAHATGHGDLLDRLKGGYLERTPAACISYGGVSRLNAAKNSPSGSKEMIKGGSVATNREGR